MKMSILLLVAVALYIFLRSTCFRVEIIIIYEKPLWLEMYDKKFSYAIP